jgi:predicted MPP superfamily phosphohydrolase
MDYYNRMHTTLLTLHKTAAWPWWRVAGVVVLLALAVGAAGFATSGAVGPALALGAGLLFFVAGDALLLAALPQLHLSYGPLQPPLVALAVVRWLVTLMGALLLLGMPSTWLLAVLAVLHLLLSAVAIYGCVIEPFHLTLTRLDVSHCKLAALPRPLRILHLTDLHMERPTRRDERVLTQTAELAPDLIVLTGDYPNLSYVDDEAAIGHAQHWLSRLHAPLGVYAVLGTPEVDVRHRVDDLFAGTGVRLLENEAVELASGGQGVALLGVTCEREPELDLAALDAVLSSLPAAGFTILLYHMPDLMPEAVSRGIDLYLAGHTHGGQWRLPGYGAVITSSVYGKRYEMGHYREGATQLYVSRGLGMEGLAAPRARFLCPPEMVLVTLHGP